MTSRADINESSAPGVPVRFDEESDEAALPSTLGSRATCADCVNHYVHALRSLNFVDAVFEDESDELTLFTVYHGRLDDVEAALYNVEADTLKRFPDVPIDFHLLNRDRTDMESLGKSALKVFGR